MSFIHPNLCFTSQFKAFTSVSHWPRTIVYFIQSILFNIQQDAFEKIISGATLVQLYTGMVYRGPRIASKISKELIDLLKNKGFKNVSEAIGTKN